jgi:Spy/CpxP family protein refolding chaperone
MIRKERPWLTGFALLTLLAALALAAPAAAQQPDPGGDPGEDIDILIGKNAPNLGLTDQQKEQLKQIRQQHVQQIQAIRNDDSLTRQQKAERIREHNRTMNQEVRSVLTPEQYQRWQEHRQERHQQRLEKRKERREAAGERQGQTRQDRRERRPGSGRP